MGAKKQKEEKRRKRKKAADERETESDIELAWTEAGRSEAPCLILLHGNEESRHHFSRQVAFFSRDFHVFALDTRGHGDSLRGERPFSLYQFARDLRHFMHVHDIPSAHLLGFSDGGNIALIFALAHPEMVNSLVLCGANLFPEGVEPSLLEEMREEYRLLKKDPSGSRARSFLSLMLFEPDIRPEKLKKLKMPSLVVAGDRDCIPEEHTRLIAESLPASTLRILRGNHFLPYEKADMFNQTVEEFYCENHFV